MPIINPRAATYDYRIQLGSIKELTKSEYGKKDSD